MWRRQFFSVAAQMEVEVVPMELKVASLAAEVEGNPTAAGRARLQGSVPRVSQAHTASRARRTRTRENVAVSVTQGQNAEATADAGA